MSNQGKYTKEEDLVILSKVKENPSNLSQCFRECSVILNRKATSISTHYYQVLAKPNHNNKGKALFSLIGGKSQNTNRKVIREEAKATKQNPTSINQSKWRRILNIIFE